VPAPDAIDDHAGSQRRRIREDLLREIPASPEPFFNSPSPLGEHRGENGAETISPGVATLPWSSTGKIAGFSRFIDQEGELRVAAVHVLRRIVDGVS